jgi:predicted choloylglycine hydrolase
MKKLKLIGNSYEIGLQLGAIYKANGRDLSDVEVNQPTLKKQLAIYSKHYPSLLEEIRGISQASGINHEKLLYVSLAKDIDFQRRKYSATEACTIFGVKTKQGLIVGRNYDWVSQARDCFQIYKMEISGRHNFFGVTDMNTWDQKHTSAKHWSFAPEDAINDKGLFIGLTFAYNHKVGYGIGSTHFIRLIAETCETVDQAIKTFRKVPASIPKNFFIADAKGDMAVVEHTSKKLAIIHPDKHGTLVKTNHYLSPSLTKEDTIIKDNFATTTFLRYAEVSQYINTHLDNFSAQHATRILRQTPYTYDDGGQFKTIWSLVLNMTDKHYNIYYDTASGEKSDMLTA